MPASDVDYETRLAVMRDFVAGFRRPDLLSLPGLPTHILDQAVAANAEASAIADKVIDHVTAVEPNHGMRPHSVTDAEQVDEAHARTLAAIVAFRVCPHIKANPCQPGLARMPLRRVDCRRCARTSTTPPPGDDDRCDWCGTHGVSEFYAMSFAVGAVVAAGDVCPDCRVGITGLPAHPPRDQHPAELSDTQESSDR